MTEVADDKLKIVIPGGSGQVGTLLARAFCTDGHEVVVLSRRAQPRPWRTVAWDGRTLGVWPTELDGADVVINLAGRSVNCRYTQENRREILDSRVSSTRVVGEAIRRATPLQESGSSQARRPSTPTVSMRPTTRRTGSSEAMSLTLRVPGASASMSRGPGRQRLTQR